MRKIAIPENNPETQMTPEALERLSKTKMLVQSTLGQVVVAMAAVPRYRNNTLADISHLIVEPLVADRIAIAHAKSGAGEAKDLLAPPAIAIWASVSQEADARIQEQLKAGAFPVRLKAADWNSGDIVWLLDVIAPTQKLATAVLTNFNGIAKSDSIKIHPIVGRLVDLEVLKKLVNASAPVVADDAEKPASVN